MAQFFARSAGGRLLALCAATSAGVTGVKALKLRFHDDKGELSSQVDKSFVEAKSELESASISTLFETRDLMVATKEIAKSAAESVEDTLDHACGVATSAVADTCQVVMMSFNDTLSRFQGDGEDSSPSPSPSFRPAHVSRAVLAYSARPAAGTTGCNNPDCRCVDCQCKDCQCGKSPSTTTADRKPTSCCSSGAASCCSPSQPSRCCCASNSGCGCERSGATVIYIFTGGYPANGTCGMPTFARGCSNPHCTCVNCTCGSDCQCGKGGRSCSNPHCTCVNCTCGSDCQCGKGGRSCSNPHCTCVNCTCGSDCQCGKGGRSCGCERTNPAGTSSPSSKAAEADSCCCE